MMKGKNKRVYQLKIRRHTGKFTNCEVLAPRYYWNLSKRDVLDKSNGVGADAWYVNFISEKIRNNLIGVNIAEPSYIHDIMYGYIVEGYTIKQYELFKRKADSLFLKNLMFVIKADYKEDIKNLKWFKKIRIWLKTRKYKLHKRLAFKLYEIVRDHGHEAFIAGKESVYGD